MTTPNAVTPQSPLGPGFKIPIEMLPLGGESTPALAADAHTSNPNRVADAAEAGKVWEDIANKVEAAGKHMPNITGATVEQIPTDAPQSITPPPVAN